MELTRDSIRPLLDLQKVDSEIDRLLALQKELPEQVELDRLTAEFEKTKKTAAQNELTAGSVARDAGKLEAEIVNLDTKIQHESTRLYSGDVSSPKELTSIQAELDGLRKRKSHVEDQLLDIMESRETAEKSRDESTSAASDLEAKVAAAAAARDDASTHIESDLIDARAKREALVPTIPDEALEIYDSIRPKREGVAVATLEGGMCRGCMVSLSPMALDTIRRSDDPLVRCENCRRLLIIV